MPKNDIIEKKKTLCMNKKNFFIKTLSIVLPILFISILFFSLYLKNLIDAETTEKFKFKGDTVLNEVSADVLIAKKSAELLAVNFETFGYKLDKDEFIKVLKKDIIENNDIFGAGVWFEPYKYREDLKYFGPYCYREKNNKIVSTFEYSTPQYNYPSWDWYKNAKNPRKRVAWSVPYYDAVLKTTFITISVPMYNKNQFIGVVTTDYVLSSLQSLIKKVKISKNGWSFVIDRQGNYIAHQITRKVMRDNILKENSAELKKLGHQVLLQKQGLTAFKMKNKTYFVYFEQIADSGLTLVSIMPTSDIYGASILNVFGAGLLLTLIVLSVLHFIITRQETFGKKRLNYILDNMNNGLIVVNKNAIIEYCNPAVEKLFLYEPSELLKQNINVILPDNVIINNFADGFNAQANGLRKNKTELPIEIKVSEVFINTGSSYLVDIYDISKHKEVERMKDEFISVISHELRTPLTSIQGSLGLICASSLDCLPQKMSGLINLAYRNTMRLTTLINDILYIKKIEADNTNIELETFDIIPIINNVLSNNTKQAEQNGLEFIFNAPTEDKFNIFANIEGYTQILTNLVSNAIKFSFPDNAIIIAVEKIDNKIRTLISNKGNKIPQEAKSEIFRKFLQLNSSDTRKPGGTGLGLCICKTLVEKFNGTIDFESTDDNTTTFYFDIPISTLN